MKTTKLTLAFLIFSLSACGTVSNNKDKSEVIAKYKYGTVTLRQAENELAKLKSDNEKLKDVKFNNLSSDQKKSIIKEIVLNEYSYREAKSRRLHKDQDYQEALKLFETEILKQKLLTHLAKQARQEKNLRKKYQELAEKLKDKEDLDIKYIAMNDQKAAEKLAKRLQKNPQYFSYHAKRKSVDKETAKKGGKLGYVLEISLPEKVAAVAKSMKKNQVSDAISVGDKWVIIKFIDKRPAEILSYEESKGSLAQNLSIKAQKDFVTKSLEDANISISVN